jgi:hypothetical protein
MGLAPVAPTTLLIGHISKWNPVIAVNAARRLMSSTQQPCDGVPDKEARISRAFELGGTSHVGFQLGVHSGPCWRTQ